MPRLLPAFPAHLFQLPPFFLSSRIQRQARAARLGEGRRGIASLLKMAGWWRECLPQPAVPRQKCEQAWRRMREQAWQVVLPRVQ